MSDRSGAPVPPSLPTQTLSAHSTGLTSEGARPGSSAGVSVEQSLNLRDSSLGFDGTTSTAGLDSMFGSRGSRRRAGNTSARSNASSLRSWDTRGLGSRSSSFTSSARSRRSRFGSSSVRSRNPFAGLSLTTRELSSDPRLQPLGAHKWDRRRIEDQNKIVAEIGRSVLEGRKPPKLLWYQFDTLSEKAKVKDTTEPGPGHYHRSRGTSSMGLQPLSDKRTAPGFTLPKRGAPSGVLRQPIAPKRKGVGIGGGTTAGKKDISDGSYRVKVPPRDLEPDADAEGTTPLEVEPAPLGSKSKTSKIRTAPSYSLGSRWKDKPPEPDMDTNNPPVLSSIGRQAVSNKASAPSAGFSRAARIKTPERTFAPNPFSYNPRHDALLRTQPAALMTGWNEPERDPYLYDAAVGSYNLQGSIGLQAEGGKLTAPRGPLMGPDRDRFRSAEEDARLHAIREKRRQEKEAFIRSRAFARTGGSLVPAPQGEQSQASLGSTAGSFS